MVENLFLNMKNINLVKNNITSYFYYKKCLDSVARSKSNLEL